MSKVTEVDFKLAAETKNDRLVGGLYMCLGYLTPESKHRLIREEIIKILRQTKELTSRYE